MEVWRRQGRAERHLRHARHRSWRWVDFERALVQGRNLGCRRNWPDVDRLRRRAFRVRQFRSPQSLCGSPQNCHESKEIYAEAGKVLPDTDADPALLTQAADKGDPLAEKVWAEIALKIGVGLTNIVWLVNPDRRRCGAGRRASV